MKKVNPSENSNFLSALSPLDGRYLPQTELLRKYFSESALIKYRIWVEVKYVITLVEFLGVEKLTVKQKKDLGDWINKLTDKDLVEVKQIEAKIRHDVKAVEMFIRKKIGEIRGIREIGGKISPWIHWGLTSEDVNNLAYSLMVQDALHQVLLPAQTDLIRQIIKLAKEHKTTIMPGRTHGQIAIPTTVGKELIVFASRAGFFLSQIMNLKLTGKLTGAVGNFNAHYLIFPRKDWLKFSTDFIKSLGLEPILITTQIEPGTRLVYVFDLLRQINNVWLDLARDCWMYICLDYFVQKMVDAEVGSSTMPHKVNPIDFENAEGNLELANSLLMMLSNKLPISRLQRDLSDSTVKRNIGVALGYSLLAVKGLLKGLNKIEPNCDYLLQEVRSHPEMLTESLQLQLKIWGQEKAYELVKNKSRGKRIEWTKLIAELGLNKKQQNLLKKWQVEGYVGLVENLIEKESNIILKLITKK